MDEKSWDWGLKIRFLICYELTILLTSEKPKDRRTDGRRDRRRDGRTDGRTDFDFDVNRNKNKFGQLKDASFRPFFRLSTWTDGRTNRHTFL